MLLGADTRSGVGSSRCQPCTCIPQSFDLSPIQASRLKTAKLQSMRTTKVPCHDTGMARASVSNAGWSKPSPTNLPEANNSRAAPSNRWHPFMWQLALIDTGDIAQTYGPATVWSGDPVALALHPTTPHLHRLKIEN